MNRNKVDVNKWNNPEVLLKYLFKKGYTEHTIYSKRGLGGKIFLFHMFYTPENRPEYFIVHPETKKLRRYTNTLGEEIGFF